MRHPRGAAGQDLIFFIFFLIILGIVWAMTGGPGRSISHSGPFLTSPFTFGTGGNGMIPSVHIPTYSTSTTGGHSESFGDILARLRGTLGGSTQVSPYASSVSVSISGKGTTPNKEYATLKISSSLKGTLSVSGWKLESQANGIIAVLGNAAELPYSAQASPETPVAVTAGATIYVVTGRSPTGASFRTNSCTGYFAQFQTFVPAMSTNGCPDPSDELKQAASTGFIPTDACVTYVDSLRSCTLVTGSTPANIGGQCQTFVADSISYAGCVDLHKDNADFYKNVWYLYLDRDQTLFRATHDQIVLVDETGKVIAATTY